MSKQLNARIKLLHLMGAAQVLSSLSSTLTAESCCGGSMDRRNDDTNQCTYGMCILNSVITSQSTPTVT